MKRIPVLVLRLLIFGALFSAASAQTTFIWTGFGTGWAGQGTPPNNGTANLYLQSAINETIALPANLSVSSIYLATDDTYKIKPASSATLPLTLSLGSGALISPTNHGNLEFDPNVNLSLTGSPVFDYGTGSIVVSGHLTGSPTTVNLTSGDMSGFGSYRFNNTGSGNTYAGSTLIVPTVAGAQVAISFWNSSPFSTGSVNAFDSVYLIAHGTQTLTNAFTFSSTTSSNVTTFRSWDAPLTLSGPMTLASNATLQAVPSPYGVNSADNLGVYPTPGAPSRNPIVLTGAITESGTHSLTVGGAGVVILQPASGSNSYTGGTTVNGSLIFGNNNAIPTGAGNVLVNNSGYVGYGDISTGNFATQLAHINATSAGAVGVDTLPGNSTITFSDPINLTGFTSTAVRIGTATSAILTGAITPQGPNFLFGNGGGSLYVQSNLPNVSTVSQLQLTDGLNSGLVFPLKLYLQGTNTYTGGSVANNGFIIFDATNSIPGSGQLTAAGTSTTNGASYIGYTDAVTGMTSATFLSKFNLSNTWGIVGFDTHAGNPTANFTGMNLTGFNNGVFLGTATSASVSGSITSTADNILRLTAANGGTFTVNSNITGSTAVVLGSPSSDIHYADGTVVLSPATANTYTGGTTFNNAGPLTLTVGGTTPLGTGPLTVTNLYGGNTIGLQAATPNYTLANNIVFQNLTAGNFLNLYLTGANSLILSGTVSGPGELDVVNTTATLTADNTTHTGDISLLNGFLYLNHNNAAGTGTVYFNGLNTDSVIFSGAATAPVLYGIKGGTGNVVLGGGMTLTFDMSNPNNSHEFGGSIGAGSPVAASVFVTSSAGGKGLYLFGNSNYTSGTTITNYGALGVGTSSSLGTGPVTLSSPQAILAINQGVTLTNPLTLTAGTLQGFGTYAPSNLTSITFNTGKTVVPGLIGVGSVNVPGTLTLATNAVFGNGGTLGWILQDVSRTDGFSQLLINGNLDLTSLSTSGFLVEVATVDLLSKTGFANLTIGTPYTFAILQTTGTITGFNPANFAINAALFESGLMPASVFSLTADSSHLYLNFTAIPEPSTWVLLAAGASLLGLAALRRRIRFARSLS